MPAAGYTFSCYNCENIRGDVDIGDSGAVNTCIENQIQQHLLTFNNLQLLLDNNFLYSNVSSIAGSLIYL